jgi:two-component system, sensor histidine kinase and response regulator
MRPKTAMIADDDPTTVTLLSAALAKVGVQSVVARDAMQAVMGAHKTLPDIILMDVNMPGGTGLNALQKLKSSSRTQLIPVIVISGVEDASLPKRVADLGAIDFFKKPIKAEDIQKRICETLGLPLPSQAKT